jgi:hypothetical protein
MDRTAFRQRVGERALRLPIWFHVAINLAAALIPLYEWITFSGLFRRWADFETATDGKHDPRFIYVMLVGAFTLAAGVLTQVIGAFMPRPTDDQISARARAFRRYEELGVWLRQHNLKLKLAAVAIGLAAAGVALLLKR